MTATIRLFINRSRLNPLPAAAAAVRDAAQAPIRAVVLRAATAEAAAAAGAAEAAEAVAVKNE